MKNLTLKDVNKLNKEMFNTLSNYHAGLISFMETLAHSVTESKINVDNRCTWIERKDSNSYLDDGSTETPGFDWSATWIFPLNNHKIDEYDDHSVKNGRCPEAIIFTVDNYNERKKDGKISGCKFFTLAINFGDYGKFNTILGISNKIKGQSIIVDYNNNNYHMLSILNVTTLVKTAMLLKNLQETITTVDGIVRRANEYEKAVNGE